MRTTIDLNDTIYKKVKATASMSGLSLKEFITRAVEHELEASGGGIESRRVRLPLVPSDNPGSLVLSSDDIAAERVLDICYGICHTVCRAAPLPAGAEV